MRRSTSFTKLITGEGTRISYTYSEIDGNGNIQSQNNRGNFIVTDDALQEHINAIDRYINEHQLCQEKEDED